MRTIPPAVGISPNSPLRWGWAINTSLSRAERNASRPTAVVSIAFSKPWTTEALALLRDLELDE